MKLMQNKWFLFAVAAGLLWGLWGAIAKVISEDVSPYMNHLLFTIGMLLTQPLVLRKCSRAQFNRKGFAWGCAAGFFAIAGNIAVFYAFSTGGKASIVIPVTNLYPLVTILIAVIAFKERLNAVNVAGVLLALPAIVLLSGQTILFSDPAAFFKEIGLHNWFLFSIGAIFSWGVFSALQKITTNHLSAEWSYTAFVVTSVLISIGFVCAGQVKLSISTQTWWLGSIAGLVNGLGVLASFAAYRAEGKAAAVTTIAGALQPVFTIVLAVLFLKEKITGTELTGILLAIAGALLLSYEKKTAAAVQPA
ncbi:MAG TPA: EamA family transporter [Chitinophagaceae bacterium]|nr:EamA family transporter [Chitinophagaceae bacterium]